MTQLRRFCDLFRSGVTKGGSLLAKAALLKSVGAQCPANVGIVMGGHSGMPGARTSPRPLSDSDRKKIENPDSFPLS